ncbi:NAD(P)/FAD-dependent oxidoreductase [Pseudidiomarina donghaiensis]|uniref:Sulfide-quinone reductase n=1 Tax=Pseudidiomarina donghaiensis TaxID=519452 RepID=A0A432XIS8_9GAMM|nr:FAD/NAD(P)-binding oxidoreductase [Pseudidiomarina donghaiensis]RUO48542.1 NAD(P)/FAD-dependent oxidoreductase [Pseudidiomarina donghaiensis]SFV23918.1 sulfide:quinone oxidoreductase [Pseudidiomarina donghaiensis]
MSKVVVVGAGLGGVSVAYELREKLAKGTDILVIGEGSEFNFVPSNPWVALGSRKREDVVMPIGELFHKRDINFSAAGVKTINADQNSLELNSGEHIDYDYLVLCTGPKLAWENVPGAGPEAGGSHSVCTVDHAVKTHDDVQALYEQPGPVLIGALPGASCFGPAYEYVLSLEYELRKRKIRDQVPITFITPEPYIGHMGLGGVGDSKGFMEHKFREHGIKWICNAKVTEFADSHCHFDELDAQGQVLTTQQLAYKHAMFLPPFKGSPAVAAVPDLCNPKGFVITDQHQRSPKYPNIFAAGVCVAIAPIEATAVPVGAPKTGLMIESMTSAIVENMKALMAQSNTLVEPTLSALCLADMGNTGAAFLAIPQNPPRNRNWTGSGRWVHWAKVAFEKYFMYKVWRGTSEPIYEKISLRFMGIERLKPPK